MTTVALKGRTFTESKRNVSLKERIANYIKEYYEENNIAITCGLLAMSGNTDAGRLYQMLRK